MKSFGRADYDVLLLLIFVRQWNNHVAGAHFAKTAIPSGVSSTSTGASCLFRFFHHKAVLVSARTHNMYLSLHAQIFLGMHWSIRGLI